MRLFILFVAFTSFAMFSVSSSFAQSYCSSCNSSGCSVGNVSSSISYPQMSSVQEPTQTWTNASPVSGVQYPQSAGNIVYSQMPSPNNYANVEYNSPTYHQPGMVLHQQQYAQPAYHSSSNMVTPQYNQPVYYSGNSYCSTPANQTSMPATYQSQSYANQSYVTPTYQTQSYPSNYQPNYQPVTHYSQPSEQFNNARYVSTLQGNYRQAQGYSMGGSGGVAQQKAQQAANMRLKGHVGGGMGGARYEGVGWSTSSAQSAIQQCCYWGTRPVAQIGVARGNDGWYACVLYQ